METNSLKGALPLLRRFLAIVLTVLSLLFLFWPSMAAVNSKARKEYLASTAKQYQKDSDSSSYYYSQYDYSKADARAMASASWMMQTTVNRVTFSFLEVRNGLSAGATQNALNEKYAKKAWEENYREWRQRYDEPYTVYNSDGERVKVSSYNEYVKATRSPETKKLYSFIDTYAVLVNILFFALLAAGLAAVVLYAMGRTRIAGIVFAALTVAADIVFIIMLAYIKKNDELFQYIGISEFTAPGASMFLLPIFSLAACILYQPSKKAKRVKARRAPRPAAASDDLFADTEGYVPPVRTNENPFTRSTGYVPPVKPEGNPFETAQRSAPRLAQRPTGNPFETAQRSAPRPVQKTAENPFSEAPRPEDAGWTCPNCDTANRADAQFCTACGSQKPAPKETVCRSCGRTLKPGARFCIYCGEQQ